MDHLRTFHGEIQLNISTLYVPSFNQQFFLIFPILFFFNFAYAYLFLRERECEQGRGRDRGRQRIWSRLLALSFQHRAWSGYQTHKSWPEVGLITDWATQTLLSKYFFEYLVHARNFPNQKHLYRLFLFPRYVVCLSWIPDNSLPLLPWHPSIFPILLICMGLCTCVSSID